MKKKKSSHASSIHKQMCVKKFRSKVKVDQNSYWKWLAKSFLFYRRQFLESDDDFKNLNRENMWPIELKTTQTKFPSKYILVLELSLFYIL